MLDKLPLISIIIPIYNVEKSIEKTISSVINQDYLNIELLLIDDGSTDGSAGICKRIALLDKRVIFFHIANRGVAYARNYGIQHAKGKYVVFVDSDDYVETSYIRKLHTLISKDGIELGICSYSEFYNDYKKKRREINKFIVDNLLGNIIDDYSFMGPRLYTPWGKIYNLSIIKKHNILFPEDMVTAEDQMFNNMYFYHVNKYGYINECLYNYHIGDNKSLSNIISKDSFLSEKKNLKFMRKFFDDRNIVNREAILLGRLVYLIFKYKKIDIDSINNAIYKGRVMSAFINKVKLLIKK